MVSVSVDLDTAVAWSHLDHEVQSHAWRLTVEKKPYEAMRVLVQATGSGPKARALVAWLAKVVIKEAGK